jgi:pyrroline-5-carboxylate reductase
MLNGWLAQGMPAAGISVVEPALGSPPPGIAVYAAPALPADFAPDIVVLAVKPQIMREVLPDYRRFAGRAAFLSIAAGRNISFMAGLLGQDAAIVRAMPNTPAMLGRGITVACANARATTRRDECARLLAAMGEVVWIDDETLMDAVTAVSGSGPAYVFLLAETMARAGEAAGLDPELAARLARATVAGAGEMLHALPDPAAVLRRNVTSPGGTTEAALALLMDEKTGLAPLMTKAVAAATRRSRELAG